MARLRGQPSENLAKTACRPGTNRALSVGVSTSSPSTTLNVQAAAWTERAPGAVPPTGGVPPEDAGRIHSAVKERSAAEDLADGLDLLLRAARKTTHSVDPRLEEIAQQALARLQEFDSGSSSLWHERSGIDPRQVEKLAVDTGKEIAAFVEHIALGVESALAGPSK